MFDKYESKCGKATREKIKVLLANQLRWRSGNIEALKSDLQKAGAAEYLPMFAGQKPKITESAQDRILLDALVANKVIASYSDKMEYYVINPKRVSMPKQTI